MLRTSQPKPAMNGLDSFVMLRTVDGYREERVVLNASDEIVHNWTFIRHTDGVSTGPIEGDWRYIWHVKQLADYLFDATNNRDDAWEAESLAILKQWHKMKVPAL